MLDDLKKTLWATADILHLLAQLEEHVADDLESDSLDFKPWQGPKEDLKVACEYAACFANAGGGVVVFGVADKVRGRAAAIVGAWAVGCRARWAAAWVV